MPQNEPDLDQAVRGAMAAANNPALRRHVENVSGVQLDRVAEIVLTHVRCETGNELRLSDVAARLGVELSSVSRKVQKMEVAGLVSRVCDPSDARAYRLCVTQQGLRSLAAVRSARGSFVDEATSAWAVSDKALLVALLTRLAADVQAASDRI